MNVDRPRKERIRASASDWYSSLKRVRIDSFSLGSRTMSSHKCLSKIPHLRSILDDSFSSSLIRVRASLLPPAPYCRDMVANGKRPRAGSGEVWSNPSKEDAFRNRRNVLTLLCILSLLSSKDHSISSASESGFAVRVNPSRENRAIKNNSRAGF